MASSHVTKVHQVPGGFPRPHYAIFVDGKWIWVITCDIDARPIPRGSAEAVVPSNPDR